MLIYILRAGEAQKYQIIQISNKECNILKRLKITNFFLSKSIDKEKEKCYNKKAVALEQPEKESTLKSKQYPLRNQETYGSKKNKKEIKMSKITRKNKTLFKLV